MWGTSYILCKGNNDLITTHQLGLIVIHSSVIPMSFVWDTKVASIYVREQVQELILILILKPF